jgi:alginate O-acetyltransferase complex protein AlgI
MLFNSFEFIFFMIAFYALYIITNHKIQNIIILVSSYIFYGYWDWRFLSLIAISTVIDFYCGQMIESAGNKKRKHLFLKLSMISNLGILGFFKYFNFFTSELIGVLNSFDININIQLLQIVLPVGISFYTFQTMSYTIDIYRGQLKPSKNFINFAAFVSFFPQLVAGPIERASNLLPQIEKKRNITHNQIKEGLWLILFGFFKKLVIADNMAMVANKTFNSPDEFGALAMAIGVFAFSWQIYGDFSGYSDIARGISKLLGIELMLNFRMPYFATSFSDFWKRWHISLSSWLRDYLYIPLGGNKKGAKRTQINLMITMLLGGLWHGASLNFVIWGFIHGFYLILQRVTPSLLTRSLNRYIKSIFIYFLVCITWIFFRSTNFESTISIFESLMRFNLVGMDNLPTVWKDLFIILIPTLIIQVYKEKEQDMNFVFKKPLVLQVLLYSTIFLFLCLYSSVSQYEFIYFQF